MTDAELLQQCKDEVAKVKYGWKTWKGMRSIIIDVDKDPFYLEGACDEAALLAIQKAREEAAPKWTEPPIEEQDIADKIRDVFDPMDMRPEEIASHLFGWFKFEKLTAPGR